MGNRREVDGEKRKKQGRRDVNCIKESESIQQKERKGKKSSR